MLKAQALHCLVMAALEALDLCMHAHLKIPGSSDAHQPRKHEQQLIASSVSRHTPLLNIIERQHKAACFHQSSLAVGRDVSKLLRLWGAGP